MRSKTSLAERIEQLYEPAARAARRGDAAQIENVLKELRSIWKSDRNSNSADAALAKGMTYSIEGILGIVLASAGADARQSLVEGRKYALPILHALGRKARESTLTLRASRPTSEGSLRMGDLAVAVGALAQNIGELVKTMSDCGLVTLTEEGAAKRVVLTPLGAQLLEACKPGWQVTEVDHDPLTQRLEEKVRLASQELAELAQRDRATRVREMELHLGLKSEPHKVYVQIHGGVIQPSATARSRYGWIEAPRADRALSKEVTHFTKGSPVSLRATARVGQLLHSAVIAGRVKAGRMGHGEE